MNNSLFNHRGRNRNIGTSSGSGSGSWSGSGSDFGTVYSGGSGSKGSMQYDKKIKPTLVEPSVKYFTREILKKCKLHRQNYYNYIFNISIGVFLVVIIGCMLYYGRKTKIYKEENKEKIEREKQEYILETCKKMNDLEEKKHSEMISNLPFESELHKYDKMFL